MTRREQMLALFPYVGEMEQKYNNGNHFTFNDKNSFIIIIQRGAYRDIQRHLSDIGQKTNDRNSLINKLAEIMINYFKGRPLNSDEFNVWHEENCEWIKKEFSTILKKDVSYGIAQKLLNMTLKHAMCFNGAEKHTEYFEYCHIPVDSYVIEWARNNWGMEYFGKWTKMGIDDYKQFQIRFSECLNNKDKNNVLKDSDGIFSPLEADFYIWRLHNFQDITNKWINEFLKINSFDVLQLFSNDVFGKRIEEMKKYCAAININKK